MPHARPGHTEGLSWGMGSPGAGEADEMELSGKTQGEPGVSPRPSGFLGCRIPDLPGDSTALPFVGLFYSFFKMPQKMNRSWGLAQQVRAPAAQAPREKVGQGNITAW